jgi:hypothetical protein
MDHQGFCGEGRDVERDEEEPLSRRPIGVDGDGGGDGRQIGLPSWLQQFSTSTCASLEANIRSLTSSSAGTDILSSRQLPDYPPAGLLSSCMLDVCHLQP